MRIVFDIIIRDMNIGETESDYASTHSIIRSERTKSNSSRSRCALFIVTPFPSRLNCSPFSLNFVAMECENDELETLTTHKTHINK
jgi:hypothetical protein